MVYSETTFITLKYCNSTKLIFVQRLILTKIQAVTVQILCLMFSSYFWKYGSIWLIRYKRVFRHKEFKNFVRFPAACIWRHLRYFTRVYNVINVLSRLYLRVSSTYLFFNLLFTKKVYIGEVINIHRFRDISL